MQYTILTRVFGGIDSAQLKAKLPVSRKDLLWPIEELFLNDATSTAALERDVVAGRRLHSSLSLLTPAN